MSCPDGSTGSVLTQITHEQRFAQQLSCVQPSLPCFYFHQLLISTQLLFYAGDTSIPVLFEGTVISVLEYMGENTTMFIVTGV